MTLVIRYWFVFVIIALAALVLFQRNTITRQDGELTVAEQANKQLAAANEANTKAIEKLAQRQLDNDAIANAVASAIDAARTREGKASEAFEREKANDPQVRDWASKPIPGSVRGAIARPN